MSLKKNPTKKPQVEDGYKPVWVKAQYGLGRVWRTDSRGYSYFVKVRVVTRKAHWRTVSVSVKAQEAREEGKSWIPAGSFERELFAAYELAGGDPVYRYHHATDVVRSLTPTADPLHNLVWGKPFLGDDLRGNFIAMRVWYIVKDTNLERFYLYGRTASFGKTRGDSIMKAATLGIVRQFLSRLETEIVREYDEKDYMELVRFVAWTAYGETGVKKGHRRRARLSKEKGFDFDEQTLKFKRVVTPWERRMVQSMIVGRRDLPKVLTRDYGGSASRFHKALMSLPKKQRRLARRYFMREVEMMEKVLEQRRKGGK